MHQAGSEGFTDCTIKHLDVAYNAFAGNAAEMVAKYRRLLVEVHFLPWAASLMSACPVCPFPVVALGFPCCHTPLARAVLHGLSQGKRAQCSQVVECFDKGKS